MKKIKADANKVSVLFRRKMNELGYETRSYYGRWASNQVCLAVVLDGRFDDVVLELSLAMRILGVPYPNLDSLGQSQVAYWPSLPFIKEDEEDEHINHDEDNEFTQVFEWVESIIDENNRESFHDTYN